MPRHYNIETIYQTLALADNVDAPANVFLGRELTTRFGTLDDSSMEDATRKVMKRLNPNFTNFAQPVRSLSGGQRQAVAIARAVQFNARVLIMDEPTAALGPAETAQVRDLVRQLKTEGIGIFLISHDIHDVFDLSDRISAWTAAQAEPGLAFRVDEDDVDRIEGVVGDHRRPGLDHLVDPALHRGQALTVVDGREEALLAASQRLRLDLQVLGEGHRDRLRVGLRQVAAIGDLRIDRDRWERRGIHVHVDRGLGGRIRRR